MTAPWMYRCDQELEAAAEAIEDALYKVHNEPPPWSGVDVEIAEAQTRLHIARVNLAAARTAHAQDLHEATVAKTTHNG